MTDETLSLDEIDALAVAVLVFAGAAPGNARHVAAAIVGAEAFGVPAHGLARLPAMAGALVRGEIEGAARPRVTRTRVGLVLADAAGGFAEPAIDAALDTLATAAREGGSALMAVTRAGECGWLDIHLYTLAAKGLVALGVARLGSSADVAPQLALALPDGDGGVALLLAPAGHDPVAVAIAAFAEGLAAGAGGSGQCLIAIDPGTIDRDGAAAPVATLVKALSAEPPAGMRHLAEADRAAGRGVVVAAGTLAAVRALAGK